MTPIFDIGDSAWAASFGREEVRVVCEDCAGETFITVIPANGKPLTIDCAGCSLGYEGPRGWLMVHQFEAQAKAIVITKVSNEVDHQGQIIEYGGLGGYIYRHENVFKTREEAMERAGFLAKQHQEEERKRFLLKEKPTRTWAWNTTYHRRGIRDAEKQLAYHRGKLEVAKAKSKEEPKS